MDEDLNEVEGSASIEASPYAGTAPTAGGGELVATKTSTNTPAPPGPLVPRASNAAPRPARRRSAFLSPGPRTRAGDPAMVHLSRDSVTGILLRSGGGVDVDGYAEGAVLNTRFGSFPHSTLIGVPWGAQVRASEVDTGSRGWLNKSRTAKAGKKKTRGDGGPDGTPAAAAAAAAEGGAEGGEKRKWDEFRGEDAQNNNADGGEAVELESEGGTPSTPLPTEKMDERDKIRQRLSQKKEPAAAKSGFLHVLPPTPELWTTCLPHRTQVVYTPDYSYILQRLRARPGTRLIEAGTGSGSFTHAAARAVFNGYYGDDDVQDEERISTTGGAADGDVLEKAPGDDEPVKAAALAQPNSAGRPRPRVGRVFSFELDSTRHAAMSAQLASHGLDGLVSVARRDVYQDGFAAADGTSPSANAVFLDLPAPWRALPHLARSRRRPAAATKGKGKGNGPANGTTAAVTTEGGEETEEVWTSPLDPAQSVHLCCFSPCIEQVQRTVSTLRALGWVEIDMVELAHRRIVVWRDNSAAGVGSWTEGNESSNNNNNNGGSTDPQPLDVEEAIEKHLGIERKAATRMAAQAPNGRSGGPSETGNDAAAEAAGPADEEDAVMAEADAAPPADEGAAVTPAAAATLTTAKTAGRRRRSAQRPVHRTDPELRSHTSYLVFAVLPREWSAADEAAAEARWPCKPAAAAGGSGGDGAGAGGADDEGRADGPPAAALAHQNAAILATASDRDERKKAKRLLMEANRARKKQRSGGGKA